MGTGNLYNIGYVSSISISGGAIFTADLTINANTISGLVDPIYPSAASNKHYVDTISGSLSTRINAAEGLDGSTASSNFFLKTSGQSIWDWYEASGINLYTISTNLDTKIDGKEDTLDGSEYYPSSLGKGISSQVEILTLHSSNSDIHFTLASIQDDFAGSSNINRALLDSISSNLRTDIDAVDDTPDTWGVLSSGYGINTLSDIGVSGAGGTVSIDMSKFVESSVAISKFYDSESDLTSLLNDNYAGSANVNWTKITAISSGFDGRLDTLEGYDQFDHELYITSSNIIANFVESGGTKWTDLTDGGETTLHTHAGMTTDVAWSGAHEFYSVSSLVNTLDAWYDASSSKLSASGALAHNKVTLAGQDYLTLSDQEITAGKLNMEDTNLTDGLGITFSTNDISVTDYIASSTAISKFLISSDFNGWKSDVTETEMDYLHGVTSDIQTQLNAVDSLGDITWGAPTQASGVVLVGTSAVSGALKVTLRDISQNVIKSGANWQKAYLSGQRVQDLFNHTLYATSANLYNQSWIDTFSGNIDTRIDAKQDALDGSEYYPSSLGHSQYLEYVGHSSNTNNPHEVAWSDVSTTAIADLNDNYAGSSNVNRALIDAISGNLDTKIDAISDTPTTWGVITAGTGIESTGDIGVSGAGATLSITQSEILTTVSSNAKSAYDWFTNSSQKLSEFIVSGDEYSSAYASTSTGVFALDGAAPTAHKDSHDPNDGSDALDCAAAGEIVGVTAAAEGTAHSFSRSDHTHQIQHAISNDHIVTMDDSDAADDDYAKFTANGLEGRDYSEVRSDLGIQELLDSGTKYTTAYTHSQDNTQAHTDYLLNNADDTTSGVLTANGFITTAGISSNIISSQAISTNSLRVANWVSPPMLFNIANIQLSSNQNINLTTFDLASTETAYIWQASACGSGGTAVSGLSIEMLAGSALPLDGSDTVYETSSQILQTGSPLGSTSAGDHVEIRLKYSGSEGGATGIVYGSGFMNISVY